MDTIIIIFTCAIVKMRIYNYACECIYVCTHAVLEFDRLEFDVDEGQAPDLSFTYEASGPITTETCPATMQFSTPATGTHTHT